MSFFEAISSGFSNYVNFSGRAQRSAYWWWTLFSILLYIVTSIIDVLIAGSGGFSPLTLIAQLALFLPSLALAVRRLHDKDKSGWFFLLIFIPLVGAIILLIWFVQRGTVGPNRFGPDPLEGRI
jgi:uncharacterized membrane protein YhaH (DUF805 family)